MESQALHARLHALGRRVLWIGAGAGLAWSLLTAFLLVLTAAWLDLVWELPPAVRIGSLAVAGLVAVGMLVLWIQRTTHGRQPQHLARRLDRTVLAQGRIMAGVDLSLQPPPASPLSAGLAKIAIEDADKLSQGVAGARVVSARPLLHASLALGALTLAFGVLQLALPALVEAQWLRFSDPHGDHPPYTRLQFEVQPGNVSVPYGSGLEIRVKASGDTVDRLYLVLQDPDSGAEETLPLFPDAREQWRGTLTQVTMPRRYFVRASAGRSRKFALGVITIPRLEAVRFRITPPAYANLGSYEGPLPQGGVAGLPGTKVQIWARSNRPLASGAMKAPGVEQTIILHPVAHGSAEATGSFEITKAGRCELRVTDADGQTSTDVFQTPVTILPDERPFVRIIEPPAVSLATPTSVLPIMLSAEDDYGVSRLQLFRSLNDSRALPFDFELPKPAPARWSATHGLPLPTYGLEPGDEIKLFARVEDNDPAGAKGFETPVIVIRIIAQEEFERLVRAKQGLAVLLAKYRAAQRRLENTADDVDRLQKKAKNKPGVADQETKDELERLAKKMKQEADALRKSAKQEFPYDIDKNLAQHLERLAKQLEDAGERVERLTREKNLDGKELSQQLSGVLDQLGKDRRQLEGEVMEPLARLEALHPLIEDQSRFVEIARRQRSLADRLDSLKDKDRTDDPAQRARMRDLQSEQQRIRTDLNRLLDDIETHVTKLPEDADLEMLKKSALDFVEQVRKSGAVEAMTDCEAGLAEFNGKRGHAGAKKAADLLEELLKDQEGANGMAGQALAGLRFQPGLAQGLGDTIEQLLAEAGLGRNQGNGSGGRSTQRNSMDNVGLFGNLPGLADAQPGQGNQPGAPGAMRPGGVRDWSRPAASDTGNNLRLPAGAADVAAPLPYRRRVADYFQRLAEELGGK